DLWIAQSGSRKWFVASMLAYSLIPLTAFIGLTILLNHDRAVRTWVDEDPNRVLSICEWIAVLAVVAKFWLAAFSWRNIAKVRVRTYLLLWTGATLLLATLAI